VVVNGAPVAGVTVNIASNDFTIQGGDQYPFRGAAFTRLGVTYQQALANYIEEAAGLNGVVSAALYPEGGEGRLTAVQP
jgi:5'-nucleotidase